jgi:hypothetical protein
MKRGFSHEEERENTNDVVSGPAGRPVAGNRLH